MSPQCFEVPPLSRAQIREIARQVRGTLAWTEPWFPVTQYLELYSCIDGEFVYDIREADEMGDNHGITFPDQKLMLLREDVYEGAVDGNGRDRLTVAHEFGHLHMHHSLGMARKFEQSDIPAFINSEWQANCFGGELLVSADHVHLCGDPWDAAQLFGVSLEAAELQWRKFRQDGLVA